MLSLREALAQAAPDSVIARVVAFEGFGGRRFGEAMIVLANEPSKPMVANSGSLLGGTADAVIVDAVRMLPPQSPGRAIRVPIGDRDAVDAGLACGGTADVLLQRRSSLPAQIQSEVMARRPVGIATVLSGQLAGVSVLVGADGERRGSTNDSTLDAQVVGALAAALLRGRSGEIVDTDAGPVVLELLLPDPEIVVLGTVTLATAISDQAAMLGWKTAVFDERAEGHIDAGVRQISLFGPLDAVVVLSHDVASSCAFLAAAVRGQCGYAGALGSRHTHSVRADHLVTEYSFDAGELHRIHGPVGLDLGARTPEETALAIVAEILASQRGKSSASLRETLGSING